MSIRSTMGGPVAAMAIGILSTAPAAAAAPQAPSPTAPPQETPLPLAAAPQAPSPFMAIDPDRRLSWQDMAGTGPSGGGAVLYQQYLGPGESTQMASRSQNSGVRFNDSAGADDFAVTDPQGWTIDEVDIWGYRQWNGDPDDWNPAMPDSFDVLFYPDAGGRPAPDTVACTAIASPYSVAYPPSGFEEFRISLSSPCVLPAGVYWVSVAANLDSATYTGFLWINLFSATAYGAAAEWRMPNNDPVGSYNPPWCPRWTDVRVCAGQYSVAGGNGFIFRLAGSIGGGQVASRPGGGNASSHGQDSNGGAGSGLSLVVTAARDNGDPAQCGAATTLDAVRGERVNFCYVVTNQTAETLAYHSLSDNIDGRLFTYEPITIAPGASYQYNRTVTLHGDTWPTTTWTALTALPSYTATPGTYDFIDISGIGTSIGYPYYAQYVELPFAFPFYQTTSPQITISANGIGWDPEIEAYSIGNPIPDPTNPHPHIRVFTGGSYTQVGGIYYATLGTAPNRRFVVQWQDLGHWFSTDGVTFQAILEEADGTIRFQYLDTEFGNPDFDHGAYKTVGLQLDGLVGDQYSHWQQVIFNETAIDWTPNPFNRYSATARPMVNIGVSTLEAPSKLAGSAASGSIAALTLAIGNSGNRELAWVVGEAPAGAPATQPTGAGGTIAYGIASDWGSFDQTWTWYPYFVRFDPAQPGNLDVVAPLLNGMYFEAAAFLNNDFTKLYVIGSDGLALHSVPKLYTLNTTTGQVTELGPILGNPYMTPSNTPRYTGMRQDPTTGIVYVVSQDVGTSWPPMVESHLFTLIVAARVVIEIGPIRPGRPRIEDIEFDATGQMYAVDGLNTALMWIDKASGAAWMYPNSLGVRTHGNGLGMAFDHAGRTAYLSTRDFHSDDASRLYMLDRPSGVVTPIAPVDSDYDLSALAFPQPAPCRQLQNVPWLSLASDQGTIQPGGSTTVAVTLDAHGLDPGTYAATICLSSNDPFNGKVAIPVSFTVTPVSDTIFADGFDAVGD